MQLSGFRVLGIGLCLAACAPLAPKVQPKPPIVAVAVPPGDVTPGFVDKEPDTCKSTPQRGLVGQPAGMLRTVPAAGPVRMVFPGTVYDQEEYRSDRANVFVDGAGIITRVTCG
jgi:Peptidase inhibitor I78 family